tara:strand:+ start:403 stop:582 length:180 start_codon:yes stop_codon:yes gene_type:complete
MDKLDDLKKLDSFLNNLSRSRFGYKRKLMMLKKRLTPLLDLNEGVDSKLDSEPIKKRVY